ncbi:ATP-binding protein [Rhodohalobacter sp. 8-1]|uniref:ATP-binding protein n=1 Tax=Rhodohalobacter sp. 8-1 TaxID=3131972 RepID=UPI0030EEA5A2
MINPEIGFTSDVITNPNRFVGRTELLRNCLKAVNTPLSLIGIHGKRGVGKSSLARQIQQIAVGNYKTLINSGLKHEIPERSREYVTVYYQCDSIIKNVEDLLERLLNDQNDSDGLLRLIPNEGKEIVEFSRADETDVGMDLKVINWGAKGIESSRYAKVVENNTVQTFRNFVDAAITHQVKKKMKRDGLLIILDEIDVIQDKSGIGSLIKSLSSESLKFAICGIGDDLFEIISDHSSVERLLEEGSINVEPMPLHECEEIISRAEVLFDGEIKFTQEVKSEIASLSQGYPYLVQLIGKECVSKANITNTDIIDSEVLDEVKSDISNGKAFPTLERQYIRAIGQSEDRKNLLYILAHQKEDRTMFDTEVGKLVLKKARRDAEDLDIKHIDQQLPRLIDPKYGPVLRKVPDMTGYYEFINPILRIYCQLRG